MTNIFEYLYPKYKLDPNKKIRLITLFSGYDSQKLAFDYLGINVEHYKAIEFDKYACQTLNEIHGTNFQPVDIKSVGGGYLDIVDKSNYQYIMTYSFPCFAGDSLVLTDKGYKEIKEVKVGDFVLTHNNKYEKVLNVYDNGVKDICRIKGMSFDEIKTTKNHKFLVRTMHREWDKQNENYKRPFEEPKWKEVEKLTKNDYLGVAINQNSIIPKWEGIDFLWRDGRKPRHKNQLEKYMTNADFWWLIGRYMGDGWIRNQGGIIICCDKNKTYEITDKLKKLFNYSISKEKTTDKIHIPLKELGLFVEQFGKGAKNKKLTNTILDLPIDLLESFIVGYESTDNYITKNGLYKISSISKSLIYGIGQCIAKVYKTPYKIYSYNRGEKYVIEGRTCNSNKIYELAYKKEKRKQDKAFYEKGYFWFPITSIEDIGQEEVYDIQVENDHSYTIQNTIVHNCTDLSLAGKRAGMQKGSGTRSSLLWEVERLLNETKELPDVLIMENVKQVLTTEGWQDWCLFLEKKGYSNYAQVLNAKNYGIPQNRERCFMISILGEYNYTFPKSMKLKYKLKDLLDSQVDEKYFISQKMILGMKKTKFNCYKYDNNNMTNKAIIKTLTTSTGERAPLFIEVVKDTENYIEWKEPGKLDIDCRAFKEDKIAPTTTTPKSKVLLNDLRIRRFTPKECFRLMGVKDSDSNKITCNDTQKYKQSGNSIVTTCLMAIYSQLFDNVDYVYYIEKLLSQLKE